jgi:ribosomal protein S18 acetylase RimI-like enzyme
VIPIIEKIWYKYNVPRSGYDLSFNYTTKEASEEQIYTHLKECNDGFIPPLDTRVDLHGYANKIYEKSITFEAWEDHTIAGLVSAYVNVEKKTAFITNVSTIKKHTGKGIASSLLSNLLKYAESHHIAEITLEVNKNNLKSVLLYDKFGFSIYEEKKDSIFMKHKIGV